MGILGWPPISSILGHKCFHTSRPSTSRHHADSLLEWNAIPPPSCATASHATDAPSAPGHNSSSVPARNAGTVCTSRAAEPKVAEPVRAWEKVKFCCTLISSSPSSSMT